MWLRSLLDLVDILPAVLEKGIAGFEAVASRKCCNPVHLHGSDVSSGSAEKQLMAQARHRKVANSTRLPGTGSSGENLRGALPVDRIDPELQWSLAAGGERSPIDSSPGCLLTSGTAPGLVRQADAEIPAVVLSMSNQFIQLFQPEPPRPGSSGFP